MAQTYEKPANRKAEHDIHPLIIGRWSPRAFSGESISDEELARLFEAARWAPSSMNSQPWRFVYAKRDTPHFERLYGLLTGGNVVWNKKAAVLIVIASKKTFDDGSANRTAIFTSGAAMENLMLQAESMGLYAHGMGGFDFNRAKTELGIPDDYEVNAMLSIGRPGKKDDLPEPFKTREVPSLRKPVAEIAFEGAFQK